ncbi:hypothetical protein F443_22236, partial [Phytophthora nicotianae P1569]
MVNGYTEAVSAFPSSWTRVPNGDVTEEETKVFMADSLWSRAKNPASTTSETGEHRTLEMWWGV